jgi:ankyrin repeat protein
MVQLLLENGADTTSQNKKGETPLHLAVKYRYDDVVPLLLGFGVDLSLVDIYGNTAARLAAVGGHYKIAQLLQVDATP